MGDIENHHTSGMLTAFSIPLSNGQHVRAFYYRNHTFTQLFGGALRLPNGVAMAHDITGEIAYLQCTRKLSREKLEEAVATVLMLGYPLDRINILQGFKP